MKNAAADFAQHVAEDTELLDCIECQVPTAHRHEEVVAVLPGGIMSEVEMSCVVCGSRRTWFDVNASRN